MKRKKENLFKNSDEKKYFLFIIQFHWLGRVQNGIEQVQLFRNIALYMQESSKTD